MARRKGPGKFPAMKRPGEQLRMFMTANEILGSYAPLFGDRQATGPQVPRDPQVPWRGVEEKSYGFGKTEGGRRYQRTEGPHPGGSPENPSYAATGRMMVPKTVETDEQLWARKREQAKGDVTSGMLTMAKTGYGHQGEKTLYEHVTEHGVENPIALGTQFPREIMGGHHRLAVMAAERPNDYMPVIHVSDTGEALGHERRLRDRLSKSGAVTQHGNQ